MKRNLNLVFFLLVGIALMGAAIFANTLGIDGNTHWGASRIALFVLGLFVALAALLVQRFAGQMEWGWQRLQTVVDGWPISARLRSNPQLARLARFCRASLFTLPIALLVIAIYLWSFGVVVARRQPEQTIGYYYELQARAFRDGKLALPINPSQELLALSNPYDPHQRHTLSPQKRAPMDFSLYKGKFYLYWGPVPALVIDAVRPFYGGLYHHGQISDLELILGFLSGTFLALYLMILIIWRRFFRQLPGWPLLVSIAMAGLANPAIVMFQGGVYEAAIAAGQFFLVSGLLVALIALLEKTPRPGGWFALTGCLWACAIGSRSVLLPSIGFLTVMLAYWVYRTRHALKQTALGLLPLGLPLVAGLAGLAWYNWARFGSLTETGFSYALAGPELQKYAGDLFSPIYIPQNLYNYLFLPFQLHAQFPFIESASGNTQALFSFYPLPEVYGANRMTGLFYSVPFVVFAVVAVLRWFPAFFKGASSGITDEAGDRDIFLWLVPCLAGMALAAFAVLQFFFWTAMRYLEDFMPALILLSLIGFWQGLSLLGTGSIRGRLYGLAGVSLAAFSVAISILIDNIIKI